LTKTREQEWLSARFPHDDVVLLRRIASARREDISSFLRRALRSEFARLGYLSSSEEKALGVRGNAELDRLIEKIRLHLEQNENSGSLDDSPAALEGHRRSSEVSRLRNNQRRAIGGNTAIDDDPVLVEEQDHS
jgi:hypothetical protein